MSEDWNMDDERLEILISRKLDGRLSEEESLELNRLIIRSHQARSLLEEHERIDRIAADALQNVLGREKTDPGLVEAFSRHAVQTEKSVASHWPFGANRMGKGLAVAAVIAMALLLGTIMNRWSLKGPVRPVVVSPGQKTDQTMIAKAPETNMLEDLQAKTMDGVDRRPGEHLSRRVLGVLDRQTGNVYMLEVGRTPVPVTPVSVNY